MQRRERSEKGENKTDGFDFELYTKLELIVVLRERDDVEDYEIGKETSARFGALDDVVVTVKLQGSTEKLTYALQAKQTMKDGQAQAGKQISCQNLWKEIGKKNYYVPKYFEAFLKIKRHTDPSQLKEMIIWTTQDIATSAKTYFVPYVPDPADDIMRSVGGSTIERWKLDWSKIDHPEYGNLQQLLLDEVHPLKGVVEKFIQVMFKKEEWHSKRGAQSCYRAMANEVIDCDRKIFLDSFVRGEGSLHPDTLIFRRIIERAMKVKMGDQFSMDKLNSDDYKQHFVLKIDDEFTKGGGQYSWNVKEYVASAQDVKDFVDRFVFYVNIPKVEDFGKKLKRKFGESKFKALCSLVKTCTLDRMASKEEIDAIFDLLALLSKSDLKSDSELRFKDDDSNLGRVLENSQRLLIEAVQDIDCSINRVFTTEEFDRTMVPCLAFRYRNFAKHKTRVTAVTKQAIVCNNGLRCILVSGVELSSIEELLNELSSFNGKIVLLTSQHVENPEILSVSHFIDEIDVDKLTDDCKSFIKSKEIDVFGNIVTVEELFSEGFIRKDNYKLALKLYRQPASECFKLGKNNLDLDPFFDSRLKELNDYFGSPIILSDHAGMGKTTELFHIANTARKRNQDCLTVFLDCKAVVSEFRDDSSVNERDKLLNVIYKVIHVDDYQKLMVQELFQSKSVFLLLDGYDEVSDASQDCLEQMIAACAASDLRGLCIATRPHCLERIKKLLAQMKTIKVYKLNPFTKEEQLDYLKKVWNTESMKEEERIRVVENASNLIETFQSVFKQESLLGIPLQMKMISTVYAEEIKSERFEQPKNFQMGSIVKRFAQRRMDLMIGKIKTDGKAQEKAFEQLRKTFPDDHVKMALLVYRGTMIDCDMKVFLDSFVKGEAESLHQDAFRFRRLFERAMRLKMGDQFSMDKIDDEFTKGRGQYSWNVKEFVASEQDVKDFVDRFFLFHVNVAKVEDFGKILERKFGESKFKALCSLGKTCKLDWMASKVEINAIFDLLRFLSIIEYVRDLFERYEPYGLVRLNPFAGFCHDTYYSYFLAMHFAKHHTDPNEFKQYMKRYLCPNRVDVASKFIDFHLGNLIRDNSKPLEDKIGEFRAYLETSCAETERFTLLRNSLNATAFNVFDVLYSSLNPSDRETLQFRFGGSNNQTENRHLINLKRLGGDQMVQLLKILALKHGGKFVTEILTKFSDDEEDFIEVACRKPFWQVFILIFETLFSVINRKREEMLNYLRRRIKVYFKVLVQNNNEVVLERIFEWARSKFSKELLATWLEDHGLLDVFVLNVGEKCDNKPLQIEERCTMVEHVSGLCRWIYGDNFELPVSCQNRIREIKHDQIKEAFQVHFGNCQ